MTTAHATRKLHLERIESVRCYIRDHLDEPLDRTTLAAVARLSVSHLHRLFVTQLGESVTSYIRYERMARAGRKLRIGAVDITEVALAAGYQTHAAFGRAFKKAFHLSPSAFRELDCNAATQLLMKGRQS